MNKLLLWLPKNIATILGIVQVAIKLLKEILTGIVNILYPIIPSAKFQKVIDTIRAIVNKVDEIIEKIKGFFLQAGAS